MIAFCPNRPQEASVSRVITIGPTPPEQLAYALARYSRSPDSIRASLDWVRAHDSSKFLESFYFQYGHASIADLGHLAVCFEGISEVAAIEIEDEQLWDGQARSSRYQDFSKSGFVTPPDFDAPQSAAYTAAGHALLAAYKEIHARASGHIAAALPRPESMKPDAYQRNIAARAFDVARYLLFLGVPTGVGQVTSIRTLERQIRRWKASEFAEIRSLGDEAASACADPPACAWDEQGSDLRVAPTLAKYVDPDPYPAQARADLKLWAEQNLPAAAGIAAPSVDLIQPNELTAEIAATLLYPVSVRSFRELYGIALDWPARRRDEVIDLALRSKPRRDELLREFRGGQFNYDMLIDIGAYRDMHRHRRCHQYRQEFVWSHGWDTPQTIIDAGLEPLYTAAMESARAVAASLPQPGAQYLTPFGVRGRFLFKMDFAEAEYISKLRSGVKGHFSYRNIAWQMKERMMELNPSLGRLIDATPPWIEDPLVR
ncbi:MAG: alternative thymidylate synthase-like protein [Candidatus Solibacter sp.]|nr:alternative thymidylate synthase-like protein [Candidatus Solibacter sp.]